MQAHIPKPRARNVPKLHESPPLDGDIQSRDIHQAEIDQCLILVLAQPLDETAAGQRLAQSVRRQTVLRETEVEERCDVDGGGAELFLLFGEVGASDLFVESRGVSRRRENCGSRSRRHWVGKGERGEDGRNR